jgi:glutamyl endopeptidase
LVEGGTLQIPADQLNVPSLDELFGFQGESVIGTDSRWKVTATTSYPSRAIAYLYVVFPNNSSGGCTGWFFSSRMVATAGHCVYNKSAGGWAKAITIYPGRNGSSAPFGSTSKYTLWTHTNWATSANHSYDYGLIRTTTAKGATVGWFGFRWQSSNIFGYGTVRGYPGDKPSGTMWTMGGTIFAGGAAGTVASRKLWYTIDTAGGQSGSPIYQYWKNPANNVYGYYGIGIHAYGIGYPSAATNSGTRITQALFNSMLAKKILYP